MRGIPFRQKAVRKRLDAIRGWSGRADPESLSLLRQLLKDENEEVRRHAARVLAATEEILRERIRASEREALASIPSGDAWYGVGQACLAMARFQDSIPVLQDHYLQGAITALTRALQYETRSDWMLALAHAHELGRQWSQAEAVARRLLDKDPFSTRSLLLLARLSYRMGRLREARLFMHRLSRVPDLDAEKKDWVQAWN